METSGGRGRGRREASQMLLTSWSSVLNFLLLLLIFITCSRRGVEGLPTVKIGALLAFNSTIGEVALTSLQLAVQDVNANASILPGYELLLDTADSSCNAFQGAAAAVELLKGEVVAVAGPQTSTLAQFVAELGVATQVPFVSFAATDPALTEASNPYFLRMVHNDAVQMGALAALIGLYGWREVAAVSTNDYVGLNSLDALSDALIPLDVSLVYRAHIPPDANQSSMVDALNSLALLEARVFVVHLQSSIGRSFFKSAQSLAMMTSGYVWLMSEAMSSILDDLPTTDPIWATTQGVVAVHAYIPPSPQLNSFQQRWSSQQPKINGAVVPMNVYGQYAYDTVWMIAHAIHTVLSSGKNFTFAPRAALAARAGGGTDLASLQILQDGDSFLQTIKDTQFVGISGPVQVDSYGDLVGADYEILNLIGKSPRVVGYWNSNWGFSQLPLYSSNDSDSSNGSASTYSTVATQIPPQLQDVIWPGGSAQIPKGWTVAKNGQKLSIGVPRKTGFPEFVDIETDLNNITTFHGFCIDVFQAAVSYLPYPLNYSYVAYGNGTVAPNYDDLVQTVADKVFDAVVGDITITTKRSKIVDFTQPYTASGLVVVVPTKTGGSSHAWAFMRPFTPLMWCTTGVFFLFTGLAIWILEHKKNKDFRGNPKKQVVTVLWFIFSTLFFSQREKTKSTLGRAVLIIWLFVVLIVISSYTASLTSILTVQQLIPTIQGIAGLVTSNLDIGYQAGSFVEDYLVQLSVPQNRLVAIGNQSDYAKDLTKGYVGAIVDELPYIQVFLSTECSFTIAGQEFTKSGWGFAFPKGSQVAVDMSTAILQMSEDGQLQQIHDYWLSGSGCGSSGGLSVNSNELGLSTFWGLFLITGVATIICVLFYYSRLIWQHHKTYRDEDTESEQSMRPKSFLRSLVSFIEEAEVKRNDGIGANDSTRKSERGHRRSESEMDLRSDGSHRRAESGGEFGGSARSDEPVLTAPTTPQHTATTY